ncbi:MAG TPA: hypothetical protein VFB60_06190 [Ktedonobacteraceae bacterium]|nr:hypothetical protein [Ktedonobacteraceae bacterium]
MQKDMIAVNIAQIAALPLPSASLVIDMRSNIQDDVIGRLRVEIADLADEMKAHDTPYWRCLTNFQDFRTLQPLSIEDIEFIRSQQKPGQTQQATPAPHTTTSAPSSTGPLGPAQQGQSSPRPQDDLASLISAGRPFEVFRRHIEEIAQKINNLRNNRIGAVNDKSTDGIVGQSIHDATVRVILLTHAEDRASLLNVSTFAAHLKEYIGKSEHKGSPGLVSITVVCLDCTGEEGPPADIIRGLSWNNKWEHLDTLIFSEKFGDNAAFIAGAMQTYLAELLLYILLIIPPLQLKSSPAPDPLLGKQLPVGAGVSTPKGEWVSLPHHSYLVGLGSMEHSARWGRRWLDYSLIISAIEVLQDQSAEEVKEVERSRSVVSKWLDDWRGRVERDTFEKIPGSIRAMQAIPHAMNVSRPTEHIFTAKGFSWSIGEMTVSDLENYLTSVEHTYNTPLNERAKRLKEVQDLAESPYAVLPPTLQDAVDSIPQIQQHLREAEGNDALLKKGAPLVGSQLEAYRVLSDPNIFIGATGAIPRARVQLAELGLVIADFQSGSQQTQLDLMERRLKLKNKGKKLIDDLKKHNEATPGLIAYLKLGIPVAVLTFILAFCLTFLTVIFLLAWLQHIVFLSAPDPNAGSFLNAAFNVKVSLLAYVAWLAIIALILGVLFMFRRAIIGEKRSAWAKEIILVLGLIVFAFAGPVLFYSQGQFANDPASSSFVSWLDPLSIWSGIAAILALIIIVGEVIWFWSWLDHLMAQREDIVKALYAQHREDVNVVRRYIADTVALQILQRAGLTDGNGSFGTYYERIDRFHNQLDEISRQAQIQRDMAANRLAFSLSEVQPGAPKTGGPWLKLDIREEWLDVVSLAAGFQRLNNHLKKDADELKEFSQLALRMMGEETPIQIEQQFREKQFSGSREQRQWHILMAIMSTLALRFAIVAPTTDSLTPILDRYEAVRSKSSQQPIALNRLIDTLQNRVRDINLRPILTNQAATTHQMSRQRLGWENVAMATGAFTTWVQMLWEGKDTELVQVLDRKGILPKLMESNQDPKEVLRRLYSHTMLFGWSDHKSGEGFLLLSPSPESSDFRQTLNIPNWLVIDFPDPERLLLFYVQRYHRAPLFIPDPEPALPTLLISPDTLTLNATSGISSQSFTIKNTSKEALSWNVALDTDAPSWVSLELPTDLSLEEEAEITVNVHADATGIPGGSAFTTGVIVNAFDPQTGKATAESPVTIPITINVVTAPMQLSGTALDFVVMPGNNPLPQTVDITNTDSFPLTWTIDSPQQTWLTVAPLLGNDAPGDTSSVSFTVDSTDLTAGTYYANVTITPSSGTPAIVTIKLTVA